LLGTWTCQRFGECRQRRLFGWWTAQGQFAVVKLSATFVSKTRSLSAALCCSGICAVAAQNGPALELKQTIALRGVEGRIDHLTYDAPGERLFICALGNNT